ncbi:hypothetical protein [Pseudomonas sp. H3(2019)]|uniref:hypothetical protein n=1 Tax=Pseudomonas sp. H3(2019) TaxID=2598724 RepID=UPI001198187A|nr:hypothetical protein [Pseudomonas sp. H3(2019)]TVT82565.1 hypothetical protein FPT12_15365 [Pseudomonas sp. H3(2019)]
MIEQAFPKITAVERIAFIETLNREVSAVHPTARAAMVSLASAPVDTDELNAAIMGAGVVGFLDGMSKRNKRIVKNTFMYADIKALMKYPAESQKEERYKLFMQTMRNLGWMVSRDNYIRHVSSEMRLTMANIAAQIIGTVVSGAIGGTPIGAALTAMTGSTLEALKKEPEALKLFEKNAKKPEGGSFALASCTQDADGEILMAVGAIQYQARQQSTSVLFGEWYSSDVSIYKGMSSMMMDEEDYAMTEDLVVKELARLREMALTLEFGVK